MGLLHSILRACSGTGRATKDTPISPDIISHPRPLMPRDYPSRGPSRRRNRTDAKFIEHPRPTSQLARPYAALQSPSASTTGSSRGQPPDGLAGLGLGMDVTMHTLRPPDMAHVAARHARYSLQTSTVTSGSSRGKKLHKTRMVEGDWELIRRDVEGMASGPGWKSVEPNDLTASRHQRQSTTTTEATSKA